MTNLFKVFMSEHINEYLQPILHSGYIGEGEEVVKFEKEFGEYIGVSWPILSTNSCTSAIHLVLLALGVGPGDEVITTPMTCIATNSSILMLGATPIWSDVNQYTGNIELNPKLITKRTKAIIAVDWTGRTCDYGTLKSWGIPVIQDAAHGPLIDPKNSGDIVCLSFGPIKHLTCGDGGAILLNKNYQDLEDNIRLLRWYGLDRTATKDFRCEQNIRVAGSKFHMNNINAAIGRANLVTLNSRVNAHISNATQLFIGIDNFFIRPTSFGTGSNYWVYPVLVYSKSNRDQLIEYLKKNDIEASQVHARNDKHTAYYYISQERPGLNVFSDHQLNIPCGWWVSETEITRMIEVINKWRPND